MTSQPPLGLRSTALALALALVSSAFATRTLASPALATGSSAPSSTALSSIAPSSTTPRSTTLSSTTQTNGSSEAPAPQAPQVPPAPADATVEAAPAASTAIAPTPQVPAPTPDEVRTRLSTHFEGALLDSSNGQDFFQTQGYTKLLSAVSQFSPEDAAARASRALDWHAAMAAPDEWRGEWVTFRGQLGSLAAEKLVSPVDGHEHVWRAIVLNDTEGEKEPPEGAVFVDLLDRPEGDFDPRREVVDVVGVFYRTVAYENYQGLPRQAGYLIGRTLKRVEKDVAKRTEMPWWGILVIGGGVAVGALHLLNILRGRSRRRPRDGALASTDFDKMFQARTKGLPPKSRPGSPPS